MSILNNNIRTNNKYIDNLIINHNENIKSIDYDNNKEYLNYLESNYIVFENKLYSNKIFVFKNDIIMLAKI